MFSYRFSPGNIEIRKILRSLSSLSTDIPSELNLQTASIGPVKEHLEVKPDKFRFRS